MLRVILNKIVFILLFISITACQSFATTWFVTLRNNLLYISEEKWPDEQSKNVVASLQDLFDNLCSPNDTVIFDGGFFNSHGLSYPLKDIGKLNILKPLTIRGSLPLDPAFSSHGGKVILDGSNLNEASIYIAKGADSTSLANFSINNGYIGIESHSTIYADRIKINNVVQGIKSSGSSIFNRVYVRNTSSYAMDLNGNETVLYSIIEGGVGIIVRVGRSPTINNSLIIGQNPNAFILTPTAHIDINNSIIVAYGSHKSNEYAIILNDRSASATLQNSLVLPSSQEGTAQYFKYPASIIEKNCFHTVPGFLKKRRPAIVVFGSDDAGNLEYFENTVCSALEVYGWHGVMAYSHPAAASEDDWAKLRMLHERGHQIASHGEYFSRNVQNHKGIILKFLGTSIDKVTISIHGTAYSDSIFFEINGEIDKTINGNGKILFHDFEYISQLCQYINSDACPNWQCSLQGEETAASHYLPDISSMHITNEGVEIDLDSQRVWMGELEDTKMLFEKKLGPGYEHTGWVGPGNGTSAEMRKMLKGYGYKAARGGYPDRGSILLENFNVYNFYTHNLHSVLQSNNPSMEQIEERIGSQIEWLKYHGGILYYYAHNAQEFSSMAWKNLLKFISKNDVQVMTLEEAANFVRSYDPSGDLHTDDDMIFTRTLADDANYHLGSNSICINAGVLYNSPPVDYSGIIIDAKNDIGPLEYPTTCPHFQDSFFLTVPCIMVNGEKYKVDFALDNEKISSEVISWLLDYDSMEKIESSKCASVNLSTLDISIPCCSVGQYNLHFPMEYMGMEDFSYKWQTNVGSIKFIK
ncbi:MAG: hypothetical protein J7K53_05645 [Bacteroidales bacterium]|nr:hypothetical protein [Bacteroidales bacterium]